MRNNNLGSVVTEGFERFYNIVHAESSITNKMNLIKIYEDGVIGFTSFELSERIAILKQDINSIHEIINDYRKLISIIQNSDRFDETAEMIFVLRVEKGYSYEKIALKILNYKGMYYDKRNVLREFQRIRKYAISRLTDEGGETS